MVFCSVHAEGPCHGGAAPFLKVIFVFARPDLRPGGAQCIGWRKRLRCGWIHPVVRVNFCVAVCVVRCGNNDDATRCIRGAIFEGRGGG